MLTTKKVTWLCCYDIPCHALCLELVPFLVALVGTYLCSDDETQNHTKFDMARILVCTKYNLVLNESFNIRVNGEAYSIKVVEYSQGPLRIVRPKYRLLSQHKLGYSSESKDASSGSGGENEPRVEVHACRVVDEEVLICGEVSISDKLTENESFISIGKDKIIKKRVVHGKPPKGLSTSNIQVPLVITPKEVEIQPIAI